ncbi:MAG: flagellar biosynthetic protein FliR [Oscillospiraceae bacterium]|nr:flagellar biosynthetic protein FliR [Oscillospiraceae bacterium]MDY6208281.1 flagellar biosynthetic protein FliR [Oscillospiraceae bacterium]
MDFWELLLSDFDIKLMVFARILGIFSFNPILARSNIPARVRVGLSLLMAYIVALALPPMEFDAGDTVGQYVLSFVAELFIGMVLGFICDLFIYMIYMAGDIMDAQAGLGMAKVFDPSTHIQMSMYGSFMGFFMYLYFFAANAHLTLIRIFVDSFEIIPLGGGHINPDLGWTIVSMFSQILVLMMQLAMPVIAAELIVEFCMGILMKTVPQIQIIVVNIQLKVIVGFVVLFAITSPMSEFIADYTDKMLNTCREMLPLIFN